VAVELRKPRGLNSRSVLMPFAPASPADFAKVLAGAEELRNLGFEVADATPLTAEGYFAGSLAGRRNEFLSELGRGDVHALVAIRGGYGSNYLLDDLAVERVDEPKVILGYSDLTSLQAYLWQRNSWVGFYGPMLAAGLDAGDGAAHGYDRGSLLAAITKTDVEVARPDAGWRGSGRASSRRVHDAGRDDRWYAVGIGYPRIAFAA